MKKRTMQEIADFFGAYVVRDKKFPVAVVSSSFPSLAVCFNDYCWVFQNRKNNSNMKSAIEINSDFVSDVQRHDWRKIVVPRICGGQTDDRA